MVLLRLRALVALPVAGIVLIAPVPKRPLFVEDAALCTSTNITVSLASYASGVSGADIHSQVAKGTGTCWGALFDFFLLSSSLSTTSLAQRTACAAAAVS